MANIRHWFWVNYSNLTDVTGIVVSKGHHPQILLFQLSVLIYPDWLNQRTKESVEAIETARWNAYRDGSALGQTMDGLLLTDTDGQHLLQPELWLRIRKLEAQGPSDSYF
jgi:hypothetical protein